MCKSCKCAEIAQLSPRPADVKLAKWNFHTRMNDGSSSAENAPGLNMTSFAILAKGTHQGLQNRTVSLQTTRLASIKVESARTVSGELKTQRPTSSSPNKNKRTAFQAHGDRYGSLDSRVKPGPRR